MKIFLGLLASAIAFYSYVPYFRDLFAGKTKPHSFSWLIWFMLTAIAFVAQVQDGGGPGAWATGLTAVLAFVIFVASLRKGEKHISYLDWASLAAAFVAMGLWAISDGPLLSVVLVTVVNAFGYVPTFRKSYHKPHEETSITYSLSAVKFAVAIAALTEFTVITLLFPLSVIIICLLLVMMLSLRRKRLGIQVDHPF